MIVVQHKCEQSASIGETIMWTGSKWVAGGDYGVGLAYFTFCPYCGIELVEPPNVMIKVSAAQMREWAYTLETVTLTLAGRETPRTRINNVLKEIKTILND